MPDPAQSRQVQLLEHVAARIKAVALAGVADTSILVRKTPWNRNMTAPGLFVTPVTEQRSSTSLAGILATNADVVIGYGAQVSLIRASNENLEVDDQWSLWRERAIGLFEPHYGAPAAAGLAWVETIEIEPGPALDSGAFARGYDAQSFVVRAIGRRRRGEAA